MLQRIMVPLDGSAFAEQALPPALTLARRARARLHLVLVRAVLPLESNAAQAEAYLRSVTDRIAAELPGRITSEVLTNEIGPLEYPLARSTVAEVLARAIRQSDTDLLIMTTHGRGGVRRAWLGSVADTLVRLAACPVLLVRPKENGAATAVEAGAELRHILVPLDGSDRSERALAHAQEIGELFDARYTLLRVVSPLVVPSPTGWYAGYTPAPIIEAERAVAIERTEDVAKRMQNIGLNVSVSLLESIAPDAAIVRFAEANAVDLIVMSSVGSSGVRRLLLGSVADKVVRTSAVPVLVCNPRRIDDAAENTEHAAMAGTG